MRIIMRYLTFVALATVFIFILASCFSSNFRIYKTDNIEAYGYIKSKNQILYNEIRIGTPQKLFNPQNKFSIKLNNGEKIISSEFSLDFIIKHAVSKHYLTEKNGWGSSAIRYDLDGFSFIFSDNKLVSFSASHILLPDKEIVPEIGDAEMKNFYKLPLSQQEIENLFGPPNKIYDRIIL